MNYNTLTQSGIIAIPVKEKELSGLGIVPNYLVIDTQSSKTKALSYDLQTSQLVEQDCIIATYKLVQREILEATEFKIEEFIERVFIPSENLNIPVDLLPILFTHQRIKDNIAIVNKVLSFFQFRGVISVLTLEVDENVLDAILGLIPQVEQNVVEEHFN